MDSLKDIIKNRRSTRIFTNQIPSESIVEEIIKSGLYAPFGGATGVPFKDVRKMFIIKQNTELIKNLRDKLNNKIKKNSKILNLILFIFPFLRKRMQLFADRLKAFSKNGIPSMHTAPYYIIIAEKKGFPPVEKESIAHAMQNMWLSATELGLGFQMITATELMSKDKHFLGLLGLKKGEYQINGCLLGYAENNSKHPREINSDEQINWL